MKVLMWCVAFLILQASGSSSGHPVNSTVQSNPQSKSKDAEQQQNTAGKPPVERTAALPVPGQQSDDDRGSNRETQIVTVSKLPALSAQRDWVDKVSLALTFALVVIGGLGVRYAARTLKAIKGQLTEIQKAGIQTNSLLAQAEIQASAAKDAAAAAKASADVLLAENRPWILLAKETTVPTNPPEDWKFCAVIANYGKTPAKIISLHVEPTLGTNNLNPPNPSIYDIEVSNPFILPPGESLQYFCRLPTPWASGDVINGKQFLWLCGFIRYSDTFETSETKPYETAFCLVYTLPMGLGKAAWARSGRKDYNRAT